MHLHYDCSLSLKRYGKEQSDTSDRSFPYLFRGRILADKDPIIINIASDDEDDLFLDIEGN